MEKKPRRLSGLSVSRSAAESRGSILIITLWSVFILSVFALISGYTVRQKLILVRRLDERNRLHYIAEGAIRTAIAKIKSWEPANVTILGNSGFSYISDESDILGSRYIVTDEERKININNADRSTLERLFRIVLDLSDTETQGLAASIVDWRDGDSFLSIPLGSAEDSYYRDLRYPYEAKDANFQVPEELLLVKGMDRFNFDKMKEYITIYGSGRVNINTASGPVLLALGTSEELLGKIMSFRIGTDGIVGSADDNFFDAPANIVTKLEQFYKLTDGEKLELSKLADFNLVTDSQNFMITGIAQFNNRKAQLETTCVFNRNGRVLYWKES